MSRAEQYQRNADEAEKRAAEVKDVEAKKIWRNIADHWREMASQAERNGW